MAVVSADKIAVLRTVIRAAPDDVIRGLETALAGESGRGGPLAPVCAMVEAESAERLLRNTILGPVAPMFSGPDPAGRLTFPRVALGLIWRGLKDREPDLVREAQMAARFWNPDDPAPPMFDDLCGKAAAALRAPRTAEFVSAAAACEAMADGRTEVLAGCLDLAPVVRPALVRLTEWVRRMNHERTATVRLAYRDSVNVADDAGPRFFEMLAAHLTEPWLILRVISAVMDKPAERYMAGSELAPFGERVMADVDVQLLAIRNFDAGQGSDAGRRAAGAVHRATEQIAEFGETIQLSRDGAWAQRINKQRKALALAVESRLKDIDEAVSRALPLQAVRYGARLVKGAPKLSDDPDAAMVGRAMALLSFADEARASAGNGGFGSTRNRILDALEKRLDQYVEDLLERIRDEEAEDPERAREFLEIAAGFLALAKDEKAAQIVRRRAAAA